MHVVVFEVNVDDVGDVKDVAEVKSWICQQFFGAKKTFARAFGKIEKYNQRTRANTGISARKMVAMGTSLGLLRDLPDQNKGSEKIVYVKLI